MTSASSSRAATFVSSTESRTSSRPAANGCHRLQIEDLISQCKGVSEAAVIGVKDDKWGERPLALVIRDAQTGDDLSETQIKAHLKAFADAGVISKFGIPDRILFVDALPKTSVGKFNKKELREKYGKSPAKS